MNRILAFSFFPAFVPPANGGQSRLYYFYSALSEWCQVTLLTSTHIGSAEETVAHGVNFIERRIPKDQSFSTEWGRLERYSSGGDLSGPCIASCAHHIGRLHAAYMEEYEKSEIIFHDSPFTVDYDWLLGLDDKRRVYNSYNCETKLYAELHPEKKSQPIRDIVAQAELKLLNTADLVMYCSEADLADFRTLAPSAKFRAVYAPNGASPHPSLYHGRKAERNKLSTVFIGSAHPPNQTAAKFIVTELATNLPDCDFHVIGGCLPEGKYPRNVKRHGVVSNEEKLAIFSQVDLALNPMGTGSGSNLKVFDAMAYGIPVISTPFGMRGINAEADCHYIQAEQDDFAAVLGKLRGQHDKLTRVGESGRILTIERYSWKAIVKSILGSVVNPDVDDVGVSDRQHVLVLNDYDSFANVGGGCTRTQGLYTAVSEWAPVIFLCFSRIRAVQVRKPLERVTVVNVPLTTAHIEEMQKTNGRYFVSADDIVASRHCVSNDILMFIYSILRKSARCIVIEHCYMVALPLAFADRFLYSSQNHETRLKENLLKEHPLKTQLLSAVAEAERAAVEHSAAIVAVTEDDAYDMLRGRRTAGPILVVPNGSLPPPPSEEIAREREKIKKKIGKRSVVFVGSAHAPNIESASWLVSKLAAQCQDIEFHIIGSVCNALIKVPRNVRLWGVLADAEKCAVMRSCSLAINPMLNGSGSNIKLADYLANGMFVISTPFGVRGYPDAVLDHTMVRELHDFSSAIYAVLTQNDPTAETSRLARHELFEQQLSMPSLGRHFLQILKSLKAEKKKVLFVTYRYTYPALGGAEVFALKLIEALGRSGEFAVDVVTTKVSAISNDRRFSEQYTFQPEMSAPINIPAVRYARFALSPVDDGILDAGLRRAWSVQVRFEQALARALPGAFAESGLLWGWDYPAIQGHAAFRWAFAESGIFTTTGGKVLLKGAVSQEAVLFAFDTAGAMLGAWPIKGNFRIAVEAPAGEIMFRTSVRPPPTDPRKLAFRLTGLSLNDNEIDLSQETLLQRQLAAQPAEKIFDLLHHAAVATRAADDVRLTELRGPHSRELDAYLADHCAKYDLVVTHNHVFRPAAAAVAAAKSAGVPSVLVPHTHLDDDFYHFPDLAQCARDASIVLASPRAAVNFLTATVGCTARYFPAGCDTGESFSDEDVAAFRKLYNDPRPFILVLGRKAAGKHYRAVLNAVEALNKDSHNVRLVMIGPDDDGKAVVSPNASYLGLQPRQIVRGALKACVALCNMSASESFGIVILEAWLAGVPVIVNRRCAAFRDLVRDGENGFLVDESELVERLHSLVSDKLLCARLASCGRELAHTYDWTRVAKDFISVCHELTSGERASHSSYAHPANAVESM